MLLVIALLCVFALGLEEGMGRILNPWAYSVAGEPTLTGEWAGELSIPGWKQSRGIAQLTLVQDQGRRRSRIRMGRLAGKARITFAPDDVRNYDLSGYTTRDGSEVSINFSLQTPRKVGIKQVQFHELSGQWQGTILTLRGTGGLVLFDGTGTITTSSDPDYPVELALRK
jgi:hypothetical protein